MQPLWNYNVFNNVNEFRHLISASLVFFVEIASGSSCLAPSCITSSLHRILSLLFPAIPCFSSYLCNKQGRIHGWPSRVRVGRGSDEIDQLGSWAGAVTPKPPVNAEKAKCYRPTDQPTDKLTDKAGWRVTCTRLKIGEAFLFMAKPAVIPFFSAVRHETSYLRIQARQTV